MRSMDSNTAGKQLKNQKKHVTILFGCWDEHVDFICSRGTSKGGHQSNASDDEARSPRTKAYETFVLFASFLETSHDARRIWTSHVRSLDVTFDLLSRMVQRDPEGKVARVGFARRDLRSKTSYEARETNKRRIGDVFFSKRIRKRRPWDATRTRCSPRNPNAEAIPQHQSKKIETPMRLKNVLVRMDPVLRNRCRKGWIRAGMLLLETGRTRDDDGDVGRIPRKEVREEIVLDHYVDDVLRPGCDARLLLSHPNPFPTRELEKTNDLLLLRNALRRRVARAQRSVSTRSSRQRRIRRDEMRALSDLVFSADRIRASKSMVSSGTNPQRETVSEFDPAWMRAKHLPKRSSSAVPARIHRERGTRKKSFFGDLFGGSTDAEDLEPCVRELKSEEEFDRILEGAGEKPVVLSASMTYCGPCKVAKPRYELMADYYKKDAIFLSVEGDTNPSTGRLLSRLKIHAVPAYRVFLRGQNVGTDLMMPLASVDANIKLLRMTLLGALKDSKG